MNNNHIFTVEKSNFIKEIEWLGDMIPYPDEHKKGDTFPMTWAADDCIYSSAGDPEWTNEKEDIKKKTVDGENHFCFKTGIDIEKFVGNPPEYKIKKINEMGNFYGYGGYGVKPSGMISVNGKIYLAVQNLKGKKIAPNLSKDYIDLKNYVGTLPYGNNIKCQHGSDATILRSDDFGKTWQPNKSPETVMFPGHMFGGPAFINFGKNNYGARDDYVYAVSADQWDNGSNLRLGRAPKNMIQDKKSWQWVSGFKNDKKRSPIWSSDIKKSIAILKDNRYISLPDIVYLQTIERYILLTWHLNMDFNAWQGSQLVIYESPEPWGSFSLIHHENLWENKMVTPYCPRLPLKWMESDGRTGWLQFSGAWHGWFNSKPELKTSPYYRSNIRKFRFIIN